MLIVGTGAVAAFLCRSLKSDFQVFGAPSARLSALDKLYSAGRESVGVSRPDEVGAHALWIVAVKAWQNSEKFELLKGAPRPQAVLVLQNGLDPEVCWRQPDWKVERGLSTYGVRSIGPGVVEGGEMGCLTLKQHSAFHDVLEQAGLAVETAADMRASVWRKLAVNASLNVVATLYGLTNGEALAHPEGAHTMLQVCGEVARLARCLGVEAEALDYWQHTQHVARQTGENICSTLADFRAGRPTEYDSINGRLLQLGRQWGVKIPALQSLDRRFSSLAKNRVSECLFP